MYKKNKESDVQRQDWKPHWSLETVHKIWMIVFTCAKVAIGALATVVLIGVVCAFSFAGILGDYLENDILPTADLVLENYEMDAPSYLYSVNGKGEIELLQELYASTDWKKADYEDIPKALIHAAIAIEDKRFYEHQGVDWFTTIKAFANMFFGDKTVGGSSITQQLIKNITEDDSVTIQRNVLEFFRATVVEKNYNKEVIIEEYLNSIYLGQGCRGVKSAAEAYFGKELQMLTIAECASLISITNNPSLFDPYGEKEFSYNGEVMNGKQRNRQRQLLVLGELLNQGYITREEYDEAVAQELVLKSKIDPEDKWVECSNGSCDYEGIRSTFKKDGDKIKCPQCNTVPDEVTNASQEVYSYFADVVITDVAKAMAKKDGVEEWNDNVWQTYVDRINRGGYHIYTTIDLEVQNQVDKVYKNLDNIPKTKSAQQLQSAIVIIDNKTGDIIAMAGGVGTEKAHFGQNRATKSKLQSGSSIKPLSVYAAGFEQGTLTPATVIKDMPVQYKNGKGWPQNVDREYNYSNTVFGGIVDSVNAIAANSLQKIGATYGYNFATEKFKLSTLVEDDIQISSLALGAQYYGVTVRDMANAFATFANKGTYRYGRTWAKVYDSKGNVVLDNPQTSEKILSDKTVNYINYCLTNAVISGTGKKANFSSGYIAGKTGTTSSARDKWFCGFTSNYTAAVWCGYDMPEKINLSTSPALTLWRKVMEPLHEGLKNEKLYNSSKMRSVTVCLDSGKIATDACAADVRGGRTQTVQVYSEDRPTKSCDVHVTVKVCSGGGVATEYCEHFATVDKTVKLESKALVKMTQKEVDEIYKAKKSGIADVYLQDNYVYLVNSNGGDATFKGIDGTLKQSNAPYAVCREHTKEAWEKYQSSLIPEPTEPVAPVVPAEPAEPAEPVTP